MGPVDSEVTASSGSSEERFRPIVQHSAPPGLMEVQWSLMEVQWSSSSALRVEVLSHRSVRGAQSGIKHEEVSRTNSNISRQSYLFFQNMCIQTTSNNIHIHEWLTTQSAFTLHVIHSFTHWGRCSVGTVSPNPRAGGRSTDPLMEERPAPSLTHSQPMTKHTVRLCVYKCLPPCVFVCVRACVCVCVCVCVAFPCQSSFLIQRSHLGGQGLQPNHERHSVCVCVK